MTGLKIPNGQVESARELCGEPVDPHCGARALGPLTDAAFRAVG